MKLLLLLLVGLVHAHTVLLPPYGKQCFFESLKKHDELSISFQVGSRDPHNAEQLKVDFSIVGPNENVLLTRLQLDHSDELLVAETNGKYRYCFSNERLSRADLDVSFNVHGVIYIDVNDPRLDSLDYAVQRLSELTAEVKNEQNYLMIRERTHRNTAELTNSRVKWWSVFQIIVVAMNSVFQIYYLKRFFEVRSVV